MKTNSVYYLSLALLVLFMQGCEVSTARITDPKVCTSLASNLCQDDMPVISAQAEELVASCILKNAPPDTKVKFTWIYYGETKIEIDNITFDSGDKGLSLDLHSTLSKPLKGWPKGVYEVEMRILIDDKKPLIKQFTIQ